MGVYTSDPFSLSTFLTAAWHCRHTEERRGMVAAGVMQWV